MDDVQEILAMIDGALVIAAALIADDLPAAIPGCGPWRLANPLEPVDGDEEPLPAILCPSVWCERCQTLRSRLGQDQLVPFTVPVADRMHPTNREVSHG